jgi:vancomycin resistance protein VanJ
MIEPSKWTKRFRLLLRILCILYGLGLIALCVLMYGWGDVWWPGTLLLFGPRWAACAPIPVFVVMCWWWKDRRAVFGVIGVTLIYLFGWMGMSAGWQSLLPGRAPIQRVRVITCNADSSLLDRQAFQRLVEEVQPEIIAMQDAGKMDSYDAIFADPKWKVVRGKRGAFLATTWEVVDREDLPSKSEYQGGGVTAYTLQKDGTKIRVVNVHMPSPRNGLESALRRQPDFQEQVQQTSHRREVASIDFKALAVKGSEPLIVAGDFNTPTESVLYRRHWGDLHDAYAKGGWGVGHTLFSRWHGIRIDHILYDSRWKCGSSWVAPHMGSDHRPVIAELELIAP